MKRIASLAAPFVLAATLFIGPLTHAASTPPEQLSAETKLQTSSGASFPLAAGWWVAHDEDMLVLQTPEKDMTLWFLELPANDLADGEAAVRESWKRVKPDFALPVERATNPPASGGWEAITQVSYTTPTAENRIVVGVARLVAKRWYVQLLDGASGAFDRRGAQLGAAVNGLEPPGLEKESFAGKTVHKLDADRLAQYRAFIEKARNDAQVPGVAIAIVQDGKVIFEEGFGVRELGKNEPVTPETLFMIGSTTKSLTTLMMSILVDKGKVSWDTPVTKLLPTFALGDAEMTKQLTMRNTFCACTGLPRQDMEFLFEYAGSTAESRLATMRTMMPTTGFGETFQYSNTLVAAGGYAAGQAAEPGLALTPAYTRALDEYLLGPLGMTSTTLDTQAATKHEHAMPHAMAYQLQTYVLPIAAEDAVLAVGPAGGAWSDLRDMEKVLLLELSDGLAPDGHRIVSKEHLEERRQPQVKVSDELNYGLGLFTGLEDGAVICHHGGNTLGFTSDFFFLPDQNVGAVVLANAGGANSFRNAARRKLFELLYDGRDEAASHLAFSMAQLTKVTDEEFAKLRPAEPEWVNSVVGHYSDPSLGLVDISAGKDAPIFDAGEWRSTFMRKTEGDGAEKIVLIDAPLAGLEFVVSQAPEGGTSFVLELPQQRYEFKRSE